MALSDTFPDITRRDEPLAPFTVLKLGGPAQFLVQPRSVDELTAVIRHCAETQTPLRVLGGGVNLLVRDEPLPGVVVRLSAPAFTSIRAEGSRIHCGCGASLSALISTAARHNLAGLEPLVGIAATVGGALRCNAGDRSGEIGAFVRRVDVLTESGVVETRERDELRFREHASNLDDPVLLSSEFELEPDAADSIVKRMRKAWIVRKATLPYSYEAAARVFHNPPGATAADVLDRAGLAGQTVGGVKVSERNANYIVAGVGATARDAVRLIDLMRSRAREATGLELQQELVVW